MKEGNKIDTSGKSEKKKKKLNLGGGKICIFLGISGNIKFESIILVIHFPKEPCEK
jgi:hypothetical protein